MQYKMLLSVLISIVFEYRLTASQFRWLQGTNTFIMTM